MTVCDSHVVRDRLQEAILLNVILLVADEGVTLREGSSFTIFSGNSDSVSLLENGSPTERLQSWPIKRLVVIEQFDPFFIEFFNDGMNVEVCRPGRDFLEEFTQDSSWDSCCGSPQFRLYYFAKLMFILIG